MPRKKLLPASIADVKNDSALVALAKTHAEEALETLREIYRDKTKESAARVAAATKLIEYAEGKPTSGEAPTIMTQVNVNLDAADQNL